MTQIMGSDGITRTLIQVQGSYRGKSGIFEWIVQGSTVVHRRFIENGILINIPNQ